MAKPDKTEQKDEAEKAESTLVEDNELDIKAEVAESGVAEPDLDDAPAAEDEAAEPAADAEEPQDAPEPVEILPVETPVAADNAPKKAGFLPLVLGGFIAAAAGFGVAQYSNGGWPFSAEVDTEFQALEAKLSSQQAELAAIRSQQESMLSTTESASQKAAAAAAAANEKLAALTLSIDNMRTDLLGLQDRLTDLEKRPVREGVSNTAIEAYERELEELKAAVRAEREETAQMEDNARVSARQALANAALARLFTALDAGGSYRPALTDLASATGADMPPVLEANADTGIPTLASLIESFPESARTALADARRANEAGEEENRVSRFLKSQLGARSVERKDGDDADAILSRAEDALKNGDLEQALAEIASLPDSGRAAMAEWVGKAEIRQETLAAAETLAQTLQSN